MPAYPTKRKLTGASKPIAKSQKELDVNDTQLAAGMSHAEREALWKWYCELKTSKEDIR